MGLLLSVLVFSVGVIEALSCYQRFRTGYLPLSYQKNRQHSQRICDLLNKLENDFSLSDVTGESSDFSLSESDRVNIRNAVASNSLLNTEYDDILLSEQADNDDNDSIASEDTVIFTCLNDIEENEFFKEGSPNKLIFLPSHEEEIEQSKDNFSSISAESEYSETARSNSNTFSSKDPKDVQSHDTIEIDSKTKIPDFHSNLSFEDSINFAENVHVQNNFSKLRRSASEPFYDNGVITGRLQLYSNSFSMDEGLNDSAVLKNDDRRSSKKRVRFNLEPVKISFDRDGNKPKSPTLTVTTTTPDKIKSKEANTATDQDGCMNKEVSNRNEINSQTEILEKLKDSEFNTDNDSTSVVEYDSKGTVKEDLLDQVLESEISARSTMTSNLDNQENILCISSNSNENVVNDVNENPKDNLNNSFDSEKFVHMESKISFDNVQKCNTPETKYETETISDNDLLLQHNDENIKKNSELDDTISLESEINVDLSKNIINKNEEKKELTNNSDCSKFNLKNVSVTNEFKNVLQSSNTEHVTQENLTKSNNDLNQRKEIDIISKSSETPYSEEDRNQELLNSTSGIITHSVPDKRNCDSNAVDDSTLDTTNQEDRGEDKKVPCRRGAVKSKLVFDRSVSKVNIQPKTSTRKSSGRRRKHLKEGSGTESEEDWGVEEVSDGIETESENESVQAISSTFERRRRRQPLEANSEVDKAFWLIFSGEYTKAMSKDWHSSHFCCWQCDESLTGQRYVLRDDHPYCIKCYESVFANSCEECSRVIGIDSKDLSYKDKHWHEACFLCSKCRVSLVDKQFGSKADKIYCGNCYDAQFASRCDGCGQIFRAGTKKMEYKTRQWHEQCFCCCVCKSAIGTKSFIPREQEIYCATCYEEKFATRCVKCNKIITSGGVTYKNEPWHRECFTCTNCGTSLAGQRFTSREDKPYCAECFGELFAKRCTACCKPITGIGGTRFISFEDRHWHNDCFICASCKTSLVGRGFITDGEDIICPECAKQKLM